MSSSSLSPPETEEDKWEFTRDLKHRVAALYGYPQEVIRKLASEVKCPHLIVKAIQGNLYEVSYRFFGHFIVTYLYVVGYFHCVRFYGHFVWQILYHASSVYYVADGWLWLSLSRHFEFNM